jgi:hypothetical protein
MTTPRRFSVVFIKLTFFFSFLSFSTLNLVTTHGLKTGAHLVALCWTVYVMCLPFLGGGILFYPLAPIIGYLPNYAWEFCAWITSIILHTLTFIYNRGIYEKTSVTHFIYWAITHPVPYWGLFIICFLPVLATMLYKKYRIPTHALWYFQLRFGLLILGLLGLGYIALHDIIILSNIHG